jgi:GxxExxY protein
VLTEKALCFLRNHWKAVTASRRISVAGELILEIKAVSTILPIHEVQTYTRMGGIRVGPLLNFNVPRLVDGLRRYVV